MANIARIIILFYIFQMCLGASKQRYFKMEKLYSCKQDVQYAVRLVNVTIRSERNFLILNGYIEVLETVRAPLELELKGERCDMDDSRCIAFSPFGCGDMCKEFSNKNNIFGKRFLSNIVPALECPLKKGLYEMRNVTADIGEFSKLPLEGSRVKPQFNVYQKHQDGRKRLIACTNAALSITMSSTRKG